MTPEVAEISEIELPCTVAGAIASWRRVFAGRNGADPRDLLQKASADLWETIEINRTVHPESHVVARQEAVDALQEMAESCGIAPDDAQLIFEQSFKRNAAPAESLAPPRLRPLDLKKFLKLAIKPREMLLDPILPEKGLAMLYAARGTGKTHVALGIAFAIATGTKFLKWTAPKPRRVLLIDGEMPAAALQERLASMIASTPELELRSRQTSRYSPAT